MNKALATIRDQATEIALLKRMVDDLISEAYQELSKWELRDLERHGFTQQNWADHKYVQMRMKNEV